MSDKRTWVAGTILTTFAATLALSACTAPQSATPSDTDRWQLVVETATGDTYITDYNMTLSDCVSAPLADAPVIYCERQTDRIEH